MAQEKIIPIYIPKSLHVRFKTETASRDKRMKEVMVDLITNYLNEGKSTLQKNSRGKK